MANAATNRVFDECLKRGLLTMAYAPSFRIQPSMTIDESTVDHVVAILDEAFHAIEVGKFGKFEHFEINWRKVR